MSLQVTPNWLTVIRIALIPAGVAALFHDTSHLWAYIAWSIFFILGLTDIADGHWARKSNRVTPLGSFLDPVADKALIGSAMISLVILDKFNIWFTVIILVREIGITIFRVLVIGDGVIPASKGGKLKTALQSFGVGFYILPIPESLYTARTIFMLAAVLLTITSGYQYIAAWNRARVR
jgi:CDP-diacylglycerol--glycerol-3-phosphate 3-phosphatidyltransferase